MFSVRAVVIDYYLSKPINEMFVEGDQNCEKPWQEPVLRIFGPTSNGATACVHVHGVFPYIYIPYWHEENPERDALLLGAALDEALRTSSNQKNFRFVHKVSVISAIPLYGYHSKEQWFLKIFFYNPNHIRRASECLLSGAILERKLQPHEAHIPYTLQFMMDFNIYGMNVVTFSKVKYRRNPDYPDSLSDVNKEDILPSNVKKGVCSYFEIDVWATDIENKNTKKASTNPGLQAIWEDEKNRRRAQNRVSQISAPVTQIRLTPKDTVSELMHKESLAKKLAGILPLKPKTPEILSISTDGSIESTSKKVSDVSSLINQEILSQVQASQKEESDEEITEADSVLGRNPKEDEKVELDDDEEGEDMTQPLDVCEIPDAEDAKESEQSEESCCGEENEFWKKMAEKIFQLDGAQDSSSESEGESIGRVCSQICDFEKSTELKLGFEPMSVNHLISGTELEMSSNWSSGILPILSEDVRCSDTSSLWQVPQNAWTSYSSKMDTLLSQTQESLPWGRTEPALNDCFNDKTRAETVSDFVTPVLNGTDCQDTNSTESYGSFLPSNKSFENPLNAVLSPLGSVTSVRESEVSANEDTGLNVPLDLEDVMSLPPFSHWNKDESLSNSDGNRLVNALKSFSCKREKNQKTVPLTLKQYIRDCDEIVKVDFKNICDREMVVIEYKSLNKKSGQSKFLIKPLDKFLDQWNVAERKLNTSKKPRKTDARTKVVEEAHLNSSMKVEENLKSLLKFSNQKSCRNGNQTPQIKSIKNTLCSDLNFSLEPPVDHHKLWNVRRGKSYKVNENVISKGKITMKLIKSNKDGRKLSTNETKKKNFKESFDCRYYSDVKTSKVVKSREDSRRIFCESSETKNEETEMNVFCSRQTRRNNKNKTKREHIPEKLKKWSKRETFTENDTKLINEINSSFEEYFRNIVKAKSYHGQNETASRRKTSDEDEESSENEVEVPEPNCRSFQKRNHDSNFVSRFLSDFSRLSRSTDVPLSITITVGDSCKSRPLPVEVSFRSSVPEKRRKKSKHRKNMCFVDGPIDSSSDNSTDSEASNYKKMKRESLYKPLRVMLRSRSDRRVFDPTERQLGGHDSEENEEFCPKVSSSSRTDPFDCRKNSKTSAEDCILRKSKNVASKNTMKKKDSFRRTWMRSILSGSKCSPDFIYDSNEGGSSKIPEKLQKDILSESLQKIPQADVVMSSSESEGFGWSPLIEDRESIEDIVKKPEKIEFIEFEENEGVKEFGKNLRKEQVQDSSPREGTSADLFSSLSLPGLKLQRESEKTTSSKVSTTEGLLFSNKSSQTPVQEGVGLLPVVPSQQITSETCDSEKNIMSPKILKKHSKECGQKSKDLLLRQTSSEELTFPEVISQNLGVEQTFMSDICSVSHFLGPSEPFCGITFIAGRKTIMPLQKTLTRKQVHEFLSQEGIRENLLGVPFYSDPLDSAEVMRLGPRILKIENEFTSTLKPFKSSLETIISIEQLRQLCLNFHENGVYMRHLLVSDRNITIVPLKKPPSFKKVINWLESLNLAKKNKKDNQKIKKKIIKPASPEQDSNSNSDSEIDLSLSLSVCDTQKSGEFSPANKVIGSKELLDAKESLKKGPFSKIKGIKRKKALLEIQPNDSNLKRRDVTENKKSNSNVSCQIEGVSCENTFGFEASPENLQELKLCRTYQYLSIVTMEIHVQTRENRRPDPQIDPIRALFYSVRFNSPTRDSETGIIVVGDLLLTGTAVSCKTLHYVATELELIRKTVDLFKAWDPDILAGYEIEMHSWGYLIQRGFVLEINLFHLLGRVENENGPAKEIIEDENDFDGVPKYIKRMRISGRIVLEVWRLLRHEIALTSYTFENVMYHLTQERHSLLSYKTLSYYWEHPSRRLRHIAAEHYLARVSGVLELLDRLDFVDRTSELSRIFGIQFYEVLSRGSQFRVESMMLRLAKPLGYVPVSPSIAQRAEMRAPASLPLILEPESLFYSDPVIVLDFQSLYPSIIIAYNYCFSTCLGRVEKLGSREPFEFGCTQLQVSPEELKSLGENFSISPAGVAFVNSFIRKGVLPIMLEEILETRLMVKKSMKDNKDDKLLQKLLFARQLGLKLIANVTYGYTAANFSGRMPCIEVGDSVVSKGRETLQRAIRLVNETHQWEAKVVYGDTDSIFVLTPGKTRQEAFRIGAEIAEAVTLSNPRPIKLKLEKVYQPCILQTKKRYAGYMFETVSVQTPVFEAKGIETVRRDGCPAVAKILEKSLRILFDTRDVSLVKKYTIRQFAKLFQGRVNLQDLIFAKEYRGRHGYRPGACVPALHLARQWTQRDKRAEPRVKERVPYVVVNGPPGVPLIRLVRSPMDLILDPSLRVNATYYITKAIIPPMQRCFSLLGVDVTAWYSEVPRKYRKMHKVSASEIRKRATISQYFSTSECISCSEITFGPICTVCERSPQIVAVRLNEKIRRWERSYNELMKVCQSCCGRPTELDCQSMDCPVFFRKHQVLRDFERVPEMHEVLTFL